MYSRRIGLTFLLAFSSMLLVRINAQETFEQKHVEVSLRMIGHRILLNAADSVSKVLPIINTNHQYRIEFESKFGFKPDDLVRAVSEVMLENKTAIRYIVEVEECETEQVVYSFEIDNESHQDIVPCNPRGQSTDCFSLVFTILEKQDIMTDLESEQKSDLNSEIAIHIGIGISVLFGIGLIAFYKRSRTSNDGLIKIGNYRFDHRNAQLILDGTASELTSKEADLLKLLHSCANRQVKREVILNEIWEDDGNYVGRTLDVFISKLRAKLQDDSSVKIVNIRGIGYKLVIND
ncbi:MAG: winged helix-turn-helix domain-containing protein [Ekhidna sp.]